MPSFQPKHISDLDKATRDEILSYLETTGIGYSKDAMLGELIAKARDFYAEQNAKPKAVKQEEPVLHAAADTTDAEALSLFQKTGFRDRAECLNVLNLIERKEVDLRNLQRTVDADLAAIERHRNDMAAREVALEQRAAEFRELVARQDAQLTEMRRLQKQR